MAIFLTALAVFFAASLVAYLAVRLPAEDWPPPGMPAFPRSLWLSTVLLLISSATMHLALHGARTDRSPALRGGMLLTTLLGGAFLACQLFSWSELLAVELRADSNLYGFTFYLLTGLHGAHVIGGLLPLVVTTVRAFRGRYSAERHTGVLLCAMYWHFLDAVWLVLFGTLVGLA